MSCKQKGFDVMSDVQTFLDKLKSDADFAKEIKASKTASEIIHTAQQHGITLTGHHRAEAMSKASPELTSDELNSVTTDTGMAAALVK